MIPALAPAAQVVRAPAISEAAASRQAGLPPRGVAPPVGAAPRRTAAAVRGAAQVGSASTSSRATPITPISGATIDWNHFSSSVAAAGFVNHRGRDMFYNPGDTVWVMAKFAYGLLDDDIKDEEVDVWLNRGCGAGWELVGTELTTDDAEHPTVEGVEDTGGWVFFDATDLDLEEGRHRFLLSVGGDRSTTEVYVDVVPAGTPVIVTDIDGTLTTEENEEFSALLTGALPQSNPDSADVLTALAEQGYRVFYLTARPHFLGQRTREFLAAHQYPLGVVHTTLTFTGATGDTAVGYKSDELAAIAARGLVPSWAFGNTASDAEAFAGANVPLDEHRIMFQFTDADFGSRRIEAYSELLPLGVSRGPARRPRRHPRVEPRAPPRAATSASRRWAPCSTRSTSGSTRRRSRTSRATRTTRWSSSTTRCCRCWRSSSRTCPRDVEHVIVCATTARRSPTGTSTTRPCSPPSPPPTPGPRSTRTAPR
jgi:hypothetical protein